MDTIRCKRSAANWFLRTYLGRIISALVLIVVVPITSVFLFLVLAYQRAGTPTVSNREFAGKDAGEGKELVPEISFRWCPAGSFTMGSPKTELEHVDTEIKNGKMRVGKERGENEDQVNVRLTSGFWLSETEVTQGQWQSVMNTTPWKETGTQGGKLSSPWIGRYRRSKEGSKYPAIDIDNSDAIAYCSKLTKRERSAGRLPSGWKYTLPTEAQWEYACRAGTITRYRFGDSDAVFAEYGWVAEKADKLEEFAHEVGLKKANAWGLRDMRGNLWEWCSDWYGRKLRGGTDPVGPSSGSDRVCRGGCWHVDQWTCRAAFRLEVEPDCRSDDVGFRVAAVHSSQ